MRGEVVIQPGPNVNIYAAEQLFYRQPCVFQGIWVKLEDLSMTEETSTHNPLKLDRLHRAYDEILNLLDRRGLLKERLPFTPGLLEEAVFFAYKMRLITQGNVKTYLDLDREGLKKIIYEWNSGDEGNCTCRLARNPFAEED